MCQHRTYSLAHCIAASLKFSPAFAYLMTTSILQHDRTFVRDVPVCQLVEALQSSDDINMVSLLTRSTMRHLEKTESRCTNACGSTALCAADWQQLQQPRWERGLRMLPLLQWMDSTHVAKVPIASMSLLFLQHRASAPIA